MPNDSNRNLRNNVGLRDKQQRRIALPQRQTAGICIHRAEQRRQKQPYQHAVRA